ncbi:MAG TPA: four-carbon acid sugar kinase family protein [Solirubrobacteraceae bacterium]|jgi:uncharacterized protein YgbK (DUF1537 family)
MTAPPLFVVDDDPTGAQAQQHVPLLLAWTPQLIDEALRASPRAIHVMTNSRALDEGQAYATVRDAVASIRSSAGAARVILRGDSTLRGHLEPEYHAVRDGLELRTSPPLLLVPALPAAGRVTIGGRHWLERHGARVPIAETEFAADATFGYRSSRLLEWAAERSNGMFAEEAGTELDLETLRGSRGADALADALLTAAALPVPTVVAPDAQTDDDLQLIAEGLRRAWRREPAIVVRCSPAFASALSGAGAVTATPLPHVRRGLLVVVGSHVAMSSAQLAVLAARHPDVVVEVDAAALAGPDAPAAVERATVTARELLERERLAVVATTREVTGDGLADGARVAGGLAAIVDALRGACDVLVSKGGITSAVNVRDGLHAQRALVVGPVAPGVSLWHAHANGDPPHRVVVFPGNVGKEDALAGLVDDLLQA